MIRAEELFSSADFPPQPARFIVAYSGGLDSRVLLHLLHDYRLTHPGIPEPLAVHVNHGLNPNAGHWAEHCRRVCADLQIPFRLLELDARAPKGESQEAWARKLRYEALLEIVGQDEILLTAHHLDDMAETLLLQLFRGAGPAGLAAMPPRSRFGAGWHCRPLLCHDRAALTDYAQQHRLEWIEDDSNRDPRFDRNLLRNTVLPLLKQRWPSLSATLYRTARLQADAADLLAQLAQIDLQTCSRRDGRELAVPALQALPRARAANLLRHWVRSCGFAVPHERQLNEVFNSVLAASAEASPCVSWADVRLRRYRDSLFLTGPLPESPEPSIRIDWDMQAICRLPLGALHALPVAGGGIHQERCQNNPLHIRYRQGDEQILVGGHHQQLRKLFQSRGIAPCYREFVPLLYWHDTLVAIPGIAVADDWRAGGNMPGIEVIWSESDTVRPGAEA